MNIITSRPELFEKSDSCIWTDPYIQQQLLDTHLNPSTDGASRNINAIHTTVDFINNEINPQSRILDLGCGPGLYTELLSQKGHYVTGVDFNRKAIEYARLHNQSDPAMKPINYIEADYIKDFPYGEYDLIILIYCDMGTHSDNERNILLKNCYNSLKSGGKLIFDVFDESLILDKREEKNWEYSPTGGFWSDQPYLLLSETFHYPEGSAFAYQYNLLKGNEENNFIVWDRYYTEQEITGILSEMNFNEIAIKKHLLKENNFTSNHEMFIIAKK